MKIVVLDTLLLGNPQRMDQIRQCGELVLCNSSDEAQKKASDAEVIITVGEKLQGPMLANFPHVKLICICSTGANNIDKDVARERGIAVCNVPEYSTESVVQHTFALLFYVLHRLRYYDDFVRSGNYEAHPMFSHFLEHAELMGKCWGIIGLGNIGSRVADLAKAFGTTVIQSGSRGEKRPWVQKMNLETLCARSDIISIHAPLTKETHHLISTRELQQMKSTAILINTGRGSVVDEEAVAHAIDTDSICAYASDVLSIEPPPANHPLLKVHNAHKVFITPHMAWASQESIDRLVAETIQNIQAFYNNEVRNRLVYSCIMHNHYVENKQTLHVKL